MRNLKLIVLSLLVSIASSQCFSKELTLFNVELGAPISKYPGCDENAGIGRICAYRADDGSVRFIELRPEKPHYLASNISVTTIDGKINELAVQTKGLKVQNEILAYLTAQYGRPTEIEHVPMGNAFGAKFSSINATWNRKEGAVFFEGVKDRIDEGWIMIQQ